MTEPVVSVVGGTGAQGGGVVDALLAARKFKVRVASRNPSSEVGRTAIGVSDASTLPRGSKTRTEFASVTFVSMGLLLKS